MKGTVALVRDEDVVYASKGVISPIYLLDAAAEAAIIIWWASWHFPNTVKKPKTVQSAPFPRPAQRQTGEPRRFELKPQESHMRKNIVSRDTISDVDNEHDWLDLGKLAQVEISSEDPSHPIESALQPGGGSGWRAAEPGQQVVRLLFDQPQGSSVIHLLVTEKELARTQEFVLRWSRDHGRTYREIVRQQYNFNPPGTTSEQEDYTVDLSGVTALELSITPDIGGSGARASLARLRLA